MNVATVKETARSWVAANLPQWPGLRAAHLVGGITAMPDDAPYPPTKDVDIHLIFEEGSPSLRAEGPFAHLIEVAYGGILIEAGLKPVSDYATAATVLANPEIAYHLTRDTALYDPSGFLATLQDGVRAGYARREWVLARLEHERRGHARALAFRPVVAETYGASGEWTILGYVTTFLPASLQVATLSPPKMGGRMLVHLRDQLARVGRLDLHEDVLAMLGVGDVARSSVEAILRQAEEAFDLALTVKQTPHPFGHKLQAHLRPYFVDCCRGMMADGYHREAFPWAGAFCLGAIDVILMDAPEAARPRFAARQAAILREIGMDTPEARAAKYAEAERIAAEIFALAEEIIAMHPEIVG